MYRLRMSFGSLWRCGVAALAAAAVGGRMRAGSGVSRPSTSTGAHCWTAPPVVVGADQVTLLRSGPATFARLKSLIDAARVSIHVEIYEFGQRVSPRLIAAHARGVAVTVIDEPSELASVTTAALLRTAGVDVVDYPCASR